MNHESTKEIVYQAVQATKKENSGLVSDLRDRISDMRIDELHEKIEEILVQTKKTNGRVTKLERITLIATVVIIVTVILKFPQFLSIIKEFI